MRAARTLPALLLAVVLMAVGGLVALFAVAARLSPPSTVAGVAATPTAGHVLTSTPSHVLTGTPSTAPPTPISTATVRPQWPRDQLALLSQADPTSHCYSNLWADTFAGRTIAFVGSKRGKNGVHVIDISDARRPVVLQLWQPDGAKDEVLDIRTFGSYAAFGGLKGVYIVDFRALEKPVQVAHIKPGPEDGVFSEVHTLALERNILFVADNTGPEVEVFDLSDPARPVRLPPITDPAKQDVHGLTAVGGRIYAATNDPRGWMTVWDISGLPDRSPVLLGHWDSGPWTHSSWPSPSGDHLAVNHETEGGVVDIWDIHDLGRPELVATITPSALDFGTHSVHETVWLGDKLYAGWGSSGAHIFDVSDPRRPGHLAGFDTTLGAGGEATNSGSWAVFPFLGPDRILTSDWHNGLFILDSTRTAPASSLPQNQGAGTLDTSC